MTSYAIARRAFDLAVDRACGQQEAGGGHPLDRWPVAEAALRLDGIRGQLDEVIAAWRQRVTAGGGVTSLDPGRLGLIRQFTARHAAIESARRVVELAALIAGDAVEPARA
jgi:alkylation response protein AidB-like acyl-CoA dehydrogenase